MAFYSTNCAMPGCHLTACEFMVESPPSDSVPMRRQFVCRDHLAPVLLWLRRSCHPEQVVVTTCHPDHSRTPPP